MERRSRNTGTLVIIVAIVAFVLGGLSGYLIKGNQQLISPSSSGFISGIGGGPAQANDQNSSNFYSKLSDFRVKLNNLFAEHAVLGADYLSNLYEGKDVSAIQPKIDQNSTQLADQIGNFYGDNAKKQFLEMWNKHISLYSEYTLSVKSKNNDRKHNARQSLYNLSAKMGEMLKNLDNNFSQQSITNLMNEHINLTLAIVDSNASSDDQAVANNKSSAFEQAGKLADYIGQVMASSHPEVIQ